MSNAEILSSVIAGVSSIASCVAIYFAYQSIRKSQQINHGGLYLNIMEKYAGDEMGVTLRAIGALKKTHGEDFAKKWKLAFEKNEVWAKEVDYHRRKLKYFYRNLSQLLKYKYIEPSLAETVCSPKGALLLEGVILKLDEQLDIPFDEDEFRDVLKIIHKVHARA